MDRQKPKEKSKRGSRNPSLRGLLEKARGNSESKELRMDEMVSILSLQRGIDKLVLESNDGLEVLCQKIAGETLKKTDFGLVGILASPADNDKLFLYGIENSFDTDIDRDKLSLELSLHKGWIVSPDKVALINLVNVSHNQCEVHFEHHATYICEVIDKLPIKSAMIIKLIARRRIVGLMVVGFTDTIAELTEKQKNLVQLISESIAVAIDNKLLYDENQIVMKKMLTTSKKLKELDETKDEFISMASHQLRTPLTSVKGYMSMVLEGDAGKLNKQQESLLNQAFVSSQRMVYLIADLLNVSRLKTGKFIIDTQPTDLGEVVEGEISQLTETAKSKKIELRYTKPKDFPKLMLDETKIRQVIMNFADNAIYYTPSGGHVDIELKQDEGNVYFTVKDDGFGVPQQDQKHLFTKFYRAGNARKARPDGTGLGLFMAKKVVDALEGSILFESHEGKGSTFGFSFDKRKLSAETKKES